MNLFGKKILNHGNARCNICDRIPWFWLPRGHVSPVIKQFEVIGAGLRYVDCPICGSSDRDRLVYHYLTQYFKEHIRETVSVLHIAPEKPIWKRWKRWKTEVIGLDKRTKGYRFVYPKNVLLGDITELPFESNRFDLVVCNHVLEHITDEAAALKGIHRVLKPSGKAILQVPFSPLRQEKRVITKYFNRFQRSAWVGQHDHVRLYANQPWEGWLSSGLEYESYPISPKIRKIHFLNPKEPLILMRKKT